MAFLTDKIDNKMKNCLTKSKKCCEVDLYELNRNRFSSEGFGTIKASKKKWLSLLLVRYVNEFDWYFAPPFTQF